MPNKSKKAQPPPQGKGKAAVTRKSAPPPKSSTSTLGLIGAVIAALAIAAVLLFVINQRQGNPGATTPGQSARVSQGGFVKGNPDAKVVVDEYGDFQ